jgi:putative transcriptional regulator
VIRLRLADLLAERGWTPYRLARETGLTIPTAYRLADVSMSFGRFTADTLDRLCEALGVQPGDLLEWVPETPARRKVERDGATRRSSTSTRRAAGRSAHPKRAKAPLKRNS